jgi:hypothetical protein
MFSLRLNYLSFSIDHSLLGFKLLAAVVAIGFLYELKYYLNWLHMRLIHLHRTPFVYENDTGV